MNKKTTTDEHNKELDELSEEMEMVGPGQILSEARKKASMTIDDVAKVLKFKTNLIENIEQDKFDQTLPATYNRGYLKSYAKFVNVDINEVLNAYDMLDVAETQRSEMLSFSNLTEKEAEHSRLMWFSYFIIAVLFGLMILWWQQEPKQTADENIIEIQTNTVVIAPASNEKSKTELLNLDKKTESKTLTTDDLALEPILEIKTEQALSVKDLIEEDQAVTAANPEKELLTIEQASVTSEVILTESPVIEISTAIFTFSGDCWVNIYDVNGERIAWGVKKSGYVMTITGEAPLKITLGKPELAVIEFNGQPIDMSGFNAGNIAKFTLPLNL